MPSCMISTQRGMIMNSWKIDNNNAVALVYTYGGWGADDPYRVGLSLHGGAVMAPITHNGNYDTENDAIDAGRRVATVLAQLMGVPCPRMECDHPCNRL